MRVRPTPGQRHEATQAEALIEGFPAGRIIGDTAFDSDQSRARVAAQGSMAVVPSNPSRAKAIDRDKHLYRERHLVECFFAKPKHFRRVATRYEKTAPNFLAMVHPASAVISLRWLSTRPSPPWSPARAGGAPPRA